MWGWWGGGRERFAPVYMFHLPRALPVHIILQRRKAQTKQMLTNAPIVSTHKTSLFPLSLNPTRACSSCLSSVAKRHHAHTQQNTSGKRRYHTHVPYLTNTTAVEVYATTTLYETLQLQHRVHQIPWQGMWVCRRARCKNVQSICCVLTIINTGISQPTFGSCCGCCGSTLGPVPGPSPLSSPSRPSPPSPLPTQLLPRPPSILREEKPKRNRAWASVGWPTNRGTRFGGPPISWAR